MGAVFGFALNKGQVAIPAVIRGQFSFSVNLMLQMFLAAAGTSALCVALLKYLLGPDAVAHRFAFREYAALGTRGVVSALLGGLVLGVGMQLSGSCPGTVWVQAGAGAPGFVGVWTGGLVGALAFSLAFDPLSRAGFFRLGQLPSRAVALPDAHGLTGVAVAAVFFGVVAAVELLDPPRLASSGGSLLQRHAWHPAASGMVVGLLQLPAALLWDELIGSSQAYVTLVGRAASAVGLRGTAYLAKYAELKNFLQVAFMAGAVLGSWLSSTLARGVADVAWAPVSIPWLESAAGGFALVFGARMAAGCTSGHGISGTSTLATCSFVATAGMFGGAIALTWLRV